MLKNKILSSFLACVIFLSTVAVPSNLVLAAQLANIQVVDSEEGSETPSQETS